LQENQEMLDGED